MVLPDATSQVEHVQVLNEALWPDERDLAPPAPGEHANPLAPTHANQHRDERGGGGARS
jgi:hypothetical protein